MIYTIGGIKGGTGKTTVATNLAVWLSKQGTDVLLVDADEQESATDFTAFREQSLNGETGYTAIKLTGETLRSQVVKLKTKYEHIVIDSGGRDTVSQRAALVVSDVVLLPFQPKISQFKEKVLDIAKHQIKEFTDIKFDYELIKRGRSFDFIKIYIGVQKPRQLEINFTETIEYQKKVATIVAYGINEDVAKQVAIKHFETFMKIKDDLNAEIKAGTRKVENARAYMVGILKNKGIIK